MIYEICLPSLMLLIIFIMAHETKISKETKYSKTKIEVINYCYYVIELYNMG